MRTELPALRLVFVLGCVLLSGCALGRAQPASEVPLYGAPGGVAVVALHGSGSGGERLLDQLSLKELADELDICLAAPDARRNASFLGTGWLESDEERLLELVDRLGGEARLVGYSSGGFQACYLALKYPERFPRVCVVAAGILERHLELMPQPERLPSFWFIAGEDDSVVPLDGGKTPIGRSLTFEGFLGPRAAAQAIGGRTEPHSSVELDLVRETEGWKPFGDPFAGSETLDCDFGKARLSIVSSRGHTDDLGPHACESILRWLVEKERVHE